MIRLLTIFAILHGTVFVGAGNAFEHLVHQMEAAAAADGHHEHHQHHADASESGAEEDWINCVFCLDGIAPAGLYIAELAPVIPARVDSQVLAPGAAVFARFDYFSARAPPPVS